MLFSFFGFNSNIFAFDNCDSFNPQVPCSLYGLDFDAVIGNNIAISFFSSSLYTVEHFENEQYYSINIIDQAQNSSIIFYNHNSMGSFFSADIHYGNWYWGDVFLSGNINIISSSNQLNISNNPQLGGGVSDYPTGENILCGINSYEICEASFPLNTQVTLDAYPNEGYAFKHWIINDVISSDTDGSIDIVMSETKNVEAVYVRIKYPVDYTPENPNGWSKVVQGFGSLNYNGTPHMGEDWNKNNDRGAQLNSIATGTVMDITSADDGWGKTVLIQHVAPSGYYFLTGTGQKLSTIYSLYAHILEQGQTNYDSTKDIQQIETQTILIGDPVGQLGDANGLYYDHLHFAILIDGTHVAGYRDNGYGWNLMGYYTDPSELISNGLYSDDSTKFSIIVHPYECGGTFKLNNTNPNCDGTSTTMGNWVRKKDSDNPFLYQLGYNGLIFSKIANSEGTASWHPNLPKSGQYKVWVYVPKSVSPNYIYANSSGAIYSVSMNGTSYLPQTVDQSAVTDSNRWVDIGNYYLDKDGNPKVSLEGDTDEENKFIAVDAVKFEYVGSAQ